MAVRIALDDLSMEQCKTIEKVLKVIPQVKQEKYAKFIKAPVARAKEAIKVYSILQFDDQWNVVNDESRPQYIHLPLTIAKKILTAEQLAKTKKEYPSFDGEKYKYCEKLRQDKLGPLQTGLQHFQEHQTTTLKLPPGYGKTILGCALWYATKTKCLVLVESISLLTQQYNSFVAACPEIEKHIWIVGEKKPKVEIWVVLCMEQRIKYIEGELMEQIGCLIVDEAHKFCTYSRVNPLLLVCPKYVIIETATLGRKDNAQEIMYAIAGTHCISQLPNKAHEVIIYQTNIRYPVVKNAMGPSFTDLQKKISEDDNVTQHVIKILKDNPHRKFMVLTNSVKHVDRLARAAKEADIEHDCMYSTKKTYSDSFCLFGTVSKIGTGFDEASFCENFKGVKSNTLILLTSMRANITVKEMEEGQDLAQIYSDEEIAQIALWEQVRGRVMRSDDPCIIYFHFNNPTVKKHISGIKPWIKVTNGKVVEVDGEQQLII